jgi:hypothetical protein
MTRPPRYAPLSFASERERERRRRRREGPPTDADRPPPSVFKGRWIEALPGQLTIDGYEHK